MRQLVVLEAHAPRNQSTTSKATRSFFCLTVMLPHPLGPACHLPLFSCTVPLRSSSFLPIIQIPNPDLADFDSSTPYLLPLSKHSNPPSVLSLSSSSVCSKCHCFPGHTSTNLLSSGNSGEGSSVKQPNCAGNSTSSPVSISTQRTS